MPDPLEELQQTLQDALEKLDELKKRNEEHTERVATELWGNPPKQSEEEYPKADDLVWSDTPLKTIDNILNQLYLDGISDAGTGGAMEDTCGEAKQAILQHFQQEQERAEVKAKISAFKGVRAWAYNTGDGHLVEVMHEKIRELDPTAPTIEELFGKGGKDE